MRLSKKIGWGSTRGWTTLEPTGQATNFVYAKAGLIKATRPKFLNDSNTRLSSEDLKPTVK